MDMAQANTVAQHPNITVAENRVTVGTSLNWIKALIATGVYCVFIYCMIFDSNLSILSLSFLLVFLIPTAIWLWYVARQKIVTTFDGFEKRAYRRNMLYCMNEVDFVDIAEIVPISESGTGGSGLHFKIALKDNPLGKGLVISNSYRENHPEAEYFIDTALPAINAMLAEAQAGTAGLANEVSLDTPTCYTRSGSQFSFQRKLRTTAILVAGVLVLILGVAKGEWVFCAVGVALVLYSMFLVHTVILDTEKKTITFGRAFGKWKTVLPMERYAGIQVTRHHTNSIYTGTSATMEFDNPEKKMAVAYVYLTRRLSVLVAETKAIINAAMKEAENKDPE